MHSVSFSATVHGKDSPVDALTFTGQLEGSGSVVERLRID